MIKLICAVLLIQAFASAQKYPPLPQLNTTYTPYNPQPNPYSPPNSYPQPGMTTTTTIIRDRPSILAKPGFNPSNDAAALRNAMKGLGTDEDGLIEILCKRPVAQRMEVVRVYKTNYGKDLIQDVKSETDGSFRDLLVALMQPKIELYTTQIHDQFSTTTLLDIMPTLSNNEMREVNGLYREKYGKELEKKIIDDLSGGFKRVMVALANGNRDESMVTNTQMARADATTLKAVFKGETDDIAANQVLCQRNFEQIKLINDEYKRMTSHDLEEDIKSKFSGDHQSALKSILRYALNRPKFFANRLFKAMDGIGTDNKSLNRIIISRCDVDMENIKDEYKKAHGETLRTAIGGDTKGDYKHALYTLINERDKPSK